MTEAEALQEILLKADCTGSLPKTDPPNHLQAEAAVFPTTSTLRSMMKRRTAGIAALIPERDVIFQKQVNADSAGNGSVVTETSEKAEYVMNSPAEDTVPVMKTDI